MNPPNYQQVLKLLKLNDNEPKPSYFPPTDAMPWNRMEHYNRLREAIFGFAWDQFTWVFRYEGKSLLGGETMGWWEEQEPSWIVVRKALRLATGYVPPVKLFNPNAKVQGIGITTYDSKEEQ